MGVANRVAPLTAEDRLLPIAKLNLKRMTAELRLRLEPVVEVEVASALLLLRLG